MTSYEIYVYFCTLTLHSSYAIYVRVCIKRNMCSVKSPMYYYIYTGPRDDDGTELCNKLAVISVE